MSLFKRWWLKTTSIAIVALLIGGGIALLSPRISISTEGNFVSINLEYGITARAAIEVTLLGTGNDKATLEYIDVSVSDIAVGNFLFCCFAVDSTFDSFKYYYDGTNFEYITTPDIYALNAGNVKCGICRIKAAHVSSNGAFVRLDGSASEAKAVTFYKVTGLVDYPLDKYNSSIGSGTDASTGTTGTLSQADELVIAATGVEDEIDDPHGTWSGVTGNEQFNATNGGGDASNIQVHSVAMVVSATTALTGVDAGHDDTDWAACIATYKMETGAGPNITNVGGDWGLGVVEESSTYWANGSEPSWPLTDPDAKWTVTNNSGASVDIYIKGTNFTGGTPGWTLASTPGEDQVVMVAFKEGDGSGDGKTLTLNDQLFIDSLGDGADIDWEMKFLSATSHSNGDIKTATVTITAQLE